MTTKMEKIKKNISLLPRKKVIGTIKLSLAASKDFDKATISRAISQFKINIADFTTRYGKTVEKMTHIKGKVPVKILVYTSGVYDIVVKNTPTVADMVREVLNIKEINPMKDGKTEVAVKITKDQVVEIAKRKQAELNVRDLDAAIKCIEGSLKSMRILII